MSVVGLFHSLACILVYSSKLVSCKRLFLDMLALVNGLFSKLQRSCCTCETSCLLLIEAAANNVHSSYMLRNIFPSVDMHPVVQNRPEHFPNYLLH